MTAYVLRRILWLLPVLFFVSLITFVLMHAVEGGPWDEDRKLPDSVIRNLNAKYGLDEPVWRQYVEFLANALQGDLGSSFARQDKPVTEIILGGFKVSAMLGGLALLVAASAGVGLGVLAAINANRGIDFASVLLASFGSAVPAFVLGIFLIYVFSVRLHWLPTFGWGSWQQVVMPVATLAALPMAFLARVTRASMLDVLGQEYVRTARAKGLADVTVLYRHSFRNAAIPVLTLLGPIMAGLVTGSFIVEHLFSIPGIGRLFVQSVAARDYGMIMGATLFYAAVIALANLAVDLTYALIDPRIRAR